MHPDDIGPSFSSGFSPFSIFDSPVLARRDRSRGLVPCMGWEGCSRLGVRHSSPGGNNSVVECDLAKVEVAGSNPVSRSNLRARSHAKVARRCLAEAGCFDASRVRPRPGGLPGRLFVRAHCMGPRRSGALVRRPERALGHPQLSERRRRQAVRQRSAKPPSPVRFRAAPPTFGANSIVCTARTIGYAQTVSNCAQGLASSRCKPLIRLTVGVDDHSPA